MITHVTLRWSSAMRTARSMQCRTAAGLITVTQYSLATSLKSACRSTSCWYWPPIAVVADWPTTATTG